jgi:DUF971 family protein
VIPNKIHLHRKSRELELTYDDRSFRLSCEFLRVHSPSAEVKGHGPGQEVLQAGKKNVAITDIRPVGNYALQLVFDDGHDSGIYSWSYLRELCEQRERLWQAYLDKLHADGATRDPDTQVIRVDL